MPSLFFLALLLSQLLLSSSLSFAQTANIKAKVVPPSLAGIHYIFDASESMCGYFSGDSSKNPLLGQIKLAVSGKNSEIGNRIYLLRQADKKTIDARRDLVEAPANLQALGEQIKTTTIKKGVGCQPFNGVGSNVELIFDINSPTKDADAVLVISDGQLVEKDREKFVQGFGAWMRDAVAEGGQPYAGIALVEAEFSGKYFPIADTSPKRRQDGYLLGVHNRPLLLIWMAKSDRHLSRIRDAIAAFAPASLEKNKDAFIQHFLPFPSVGLGVMQNKSNFKPTLEELIIKKPKVEIQKFDKSREDTILSGCLRSFISGNQILIETDAKCRDGKPIFDGLSSIGISFPLATDKPFSTAAKSPNDGVPGHLSFKLTSKSYGEQPFSLQHSIGNTVTNRVDVKPYSFDSDACIEKISVAIKRATEEVDDICTEKLAAKAYQLDVLFSQLLERQELANGQLLTPLNNTKYVFEFRQKK